MQVRNIKLNMVPSSSVNLFFFITSFPKYLWSRANQIYRLLQLAFQGIIKKASIIKTYLVSRMFWGRGNLYRNAFHFSITLLTVLTLATGLVSHLQRYDANAQALEVAYGQVGTVDLLQQGDSIHSVLPVDPESPDLRIRHHKVQPGETLESIAKDFKVHVDTIRWANSTLIDPFGDEIVVGWDLSIPEVDGVLYKVKYGQALADVARVTGGNEIDIIEVNELVPPEYKISPGQNLFVPSGSLSESEIEINGIPKGVFDNPLSHPACRGYHLTRGYTSYHDGLDLAKYGGCPIRAIAAGRVIFAGWSSLAGFNVRIDHGGGIVSKYYHGTGEFWVKVGDRVQQGQEIMMMGTSGNSTGTHLHLTITYNGHTVNPGLYVPY